MVAWSLLDITPAPRLRAAGERVRAWSRANTVQRPTLSGKSGGRWHHVIYSQTAVAKRAERAKNTPLGSLQKEGGCGAEGLITYTKLTLTGALRLPSPSGGLAGLQRWCFGRGARRKPLGFTGL